MILGYSNIIRLINDKNLLSEYDESNILNSSCRLKVGKIFVPEEGTVIDCLNGAEKDSFLSKARAWLADSIDPRHNCKDGIPQWISVDDYSYTLKPREIILFQTKETIRLPKDIMAMYSALNTVATQGILLINASMIEANYEGPLSGILVNFSNVNFEITPNMDIAKISFFKIDGEIKDSDATDNQTEEDIYAQKLREKAKCIFSKTFLSISQLGDEIEHKVSKTIKKDLAIGGLILVFLLAFATIEPFIYKCLWGYPTFDYNDWDKKNLGQIRWSEDKEMIMIMQNQIDSLKRLYKENKNDTEIISSTGRVQ